MVSGTPRPSPSAWANWRSRPPSSSIRKSWATPCSTCARRRRSRRPCWWRRHGRAVRRRCWSIPMPPTAASRSPVTGRRPTAATSPTAPPRAATRKPRSVSSRSRPARLCPTRCRTRAAAPRRRRWCGMPTARASPMCGSRCRARFRTPTCNSTPRCTTTRSAAMRKTTRWHSARAGPRSRNTRCWVRPTASTPPRWCTRAMAIRTRCTCVPATGRGSRRSAPKRTCAPRGKSIRVRPGAAIACWFLITEVRGPDWRVQQYSSDGKFIRTVPLPQTGIGVGTIAGSATSPHALITYSGWTIPSRWAEYNAQHGTLKTVFEVKPAADYSKVVTYRLDATSKDGTRVPVTVIALKGVTPNGSRPTILYGYGGFGICTAPRFLGSNLAWLERGGVYAVANIRGGGEYGEGWHADGMLSKKQNVFDDFYAAAQALVQQHWTDPAHLGILGGSNGGLLMGAALTQHPSEYRAVVSLV